MAIDLSRDADVRDTLASHLLRDAVQQLGFGDVARVIGVSPDCVRRWAAAERGLSFSDRVAVAMTVIALAPAGSDLLASAARLRLQLAATIEYEAGVTRATETPPRVALRLH